MSLPPTPPLSYTDEHEEILKDHSKGKSRATYLPKMSNLTPSTGETSTASKSSATNKQSLLSVPHSWLTTYNTWVRHNASSVSQIESALRSLNYLIPARVPSSTSPSTSTFASLLSTDILSESYHSSIQLLSLYHDSILLRSLSKLPGMPSLSRPSRPLNRYTRYWALRSKIYRRTAMLLMVIRYTELLAEMAAKRRGERVRWRVVVVIEVLKAICKGVLLQVTGGRMGVGPLPDRETGEEEGEEGVERELSFEEEMGLELPKEETDSAYGSGSDSGHLAGQRGRGGKGSYKMLRTGLTLPTLPKSEDIMAFLMKKVLTAEDIKPAAALLSKLQYSPRLLAEILHILRPVIYAVAMARLARNAGYGERDADWKRRWGPWVLGISIELAARQLRSSGSGSENGKWGREAPRETPLEKEEWDRRAWAMGWWALKGAFYENVTKKVVDGVVESRWCPGIVGGVLADYRGLWDEFYFSTGGD